MSSLMLSKAPKYADDIEGVLKAFFNNEKTPKDTKIFRKADIQTGYFIAKICFLLPLACITTKFLKVTISTRTQL